jgi:type VI secretion system secreted protein Hcp
MAFDSFLYFQGKGASDTFLPQGESTDEQFKGVHAFEIKSFSFSAQNNVTIGSQSQGAGAGRCVLEKFKFQKAIDRGSPVLFNACTAGKHFPAAVLVLRKAGGATSSQHQPCYLVFRFLFCYIDTISWSGSSGDDVPTEDVSFAYGAMQINYRKQDAEGKLWGQTMEGVWSQVNNRPEFAVSAAGAISAGDISSKLPTGVVGGA